MAQLTVLRNTVLKKSTAAAFMLSAEDKVRLQSGRSLAVESAVRVGRHCRVKLLQPLSPLGSIGYIPLDHVEVPLDEVRGVWLTNTDSKLLHSRESIQKGFHKLRQLGFNTVYPVVWQRGFTLYPSSVAASFIGESVMPNSAYANRDMLAEVVDAAHEHQLRVIPWFEYGLAAPPGSQLAQRQAALLTLDPTGNPIRTKRTDGKPDFFVWLNPCQPQVQQFLVELISDVITRYPVDGIQLDDHFGFPVELGYDPLTQDLYRQEHRGRPMPSQATNPQRLRWMAKQMTALLRQIHRVVKTQKGVISLSPNPLGFSKTNYSVDWQAWVQEALIDELVLQVYRDNLGSFIAEISKPEIFAVQSRIPTAIGILSGIKTRSVSSSQMRQQLQEVRRRNLSGVAFFFYETVLHEQLAPSLVARNPEALSQLFA